MTTNKIFIKIRAKMRAHEAKTRALAMPYKDTDPSQQKSRKCVLHWHQKKLFYSLFQSRQKYYESSKTEYLDSTSFINRLTPLNFSGLWNFFKGLQGGFPQQISTFVLLQFFVNILYCNYRPSNLLLPPYINLMKNRVNLTWK